ncbi:lysozyme inhibitor LprI family protein [Spirosoma sp. KUDC1026]|uniref:lysozyme inhibitor LprI family protein n=1 Tax=Spirosoma sp. KUDC1026 TaxID=2745947 RepID=UPI00159B8BD0|nr:lysozyme inhibitor LprI family protein [Spirosoma sp. KUDC1026]QKZ12285.1 DUF1311 domain-containing protein [Spirosoma sp. KUDC1026]
MLASDFLKKLGLLISFLLLVIGAHAQRSKSTSASKPLDCDEAMSQTELNRCAWERLERADRQLNTLYKRLIGQLPADSRALVVKAQRQWLLYRDAHCAYYDKTYEGGSMQPMVVALCKEATTLSRIRELQALLEEPH